jgi:hypothetical protein
MRTTLNLPDDIFQELKSQAALRGLKLKQFLSEIISSSLDRSPVPSGMPRSTLPVVIPATGKMRMALSNQEIEEILTLE